MTDSHTLLSQYARTGSESAFRELVSRYIDLVYSTAFRLVDGNVESAQDVAQTVFVALADQARTLPKDVMLGGWLHLRTRFAAGKLMRSERRRQLRERQAAEMNAIEDHSESNLAQVAPVLDEAIGQLDAEDRTAILLRFFERNDFRSVGEALGTSEDAARKRVDRALDKLHVLLKHRGATLSVAGLGTALATEAVTAAPAGLAASISAATIACELLGPKARAAIPALIPLLEDQDGAIRAQAVAALCFIQQDVDTVVPLVAERLADTDMRVVQLAVNGLPMFGAKARPAVPALRKLTQSQYPRPQRPGVGFNAAD
jgi:RNA polymerase sigma factor (sigma-70 family)